jgi:signal transduction histidine kinase
MAGALVLLCAEEALELQTSTMTVIFLLGFVALSALLGLGLRDLRRADRRTAVALERAAAAESVQRVRADELARVLEASQSLVLTGEGRVDFTGLLAAITPLGATTFLVRITDDVGSVVAAHGPLATTVIGVTHQIESAPGATWDLPLASYSAAGHAVGVAMPREHLAALGQDLQAALSIALRDRSGKAIGTLHMIDPIAERVLEPSFVSLAQLLANQLTVAVENNGLMGRLRHELVEGQRMQQQLIQASKLGAVGELAAAVAHEVNNPLTGILGFSELLLTEIPTDDPRHEEVSVIRAEAVRARTIVRALLEFARPRAPQRIPTSLNDLARTTLDLVRFRAADAGIRIDAEFGELPCLDIDPDALKQVLLNLFNNAIDAMPAGGWLRVSTHSVGDRVKVTVADNGVGMNDETRGRIFAPFFTTRASNGVGSGLGLSVSRQIVEGHGGTIEVDSKAGCGATFTVWLPAITSDFQGTFLVPGAAAERAGASGDEQEPARRPAGDMPSARSESAA